jgi:hypothetical protein
MEQFCPFRNCHATIAEVPRPSDEHEISRTTAMGRRGSDDDTHVFVAGSSG